MVESNNWVKIPELNNEYSINKNGSVKCTSNNKLIKVNSAGSRKGEYYPAICIKGKTYYIHRLLYSVFIGEIGNKFVDHIDGNKSNNSLDNLRLATRSQNGANSKKRKNTLFPWRGIDRRVLPCGKTVYRSKIQKNGRGYTSRGFDTPEEAAFNYNMRARALHGKFAKINPVYDLGVYDA